MEKLIIRHNEEYFEYISIEAESVLRYAIRGPNESIGPNRLVPSPLVLDTLFSFPVTMKRVSEQQERIKMLHSDRAEVEQNRAEQHITTALSSNAPSPTK